MQEGMAVAEDMDEVIALHERFLDVCLKECLLASQDLLKILTKIMTTCLLFADQMRRFAAESEEAYSSTGLKGVAAKQQSMAEQQAFINYETSHDVYKNTICKFEDTFDEQVLPYF
jgi:hypothetical protein